MKHADEKRSAASSAQRSDIKTPDSVKYDDEARARAAASTRAATRA